MRIAHVSDLHIRNFKYRSEYRAAFEHLYDQLSDLRPDLIINTGDTVHSKLAVSPELFEDVAHHCISMTEIAPYWMILGNHDLNLKNKARTDAISPIVSALQGRTRHELRLLDDGMHDLAGFDHRFWNYDIRGHADHVPDDGHVNVGLYHGSISGCVTDIGFVMEEGESEVKKFDRMDYVLLGDIHKRQSFRDGRIRYPGSLIQQNYGEELVKGFLLWDIVDKKQFSVDFHEVNAPGRFYTIQVPASLELDGIVIPQKSRVRAIVEGELTPSRRVELEKRLRETFDPLEVITPDSSGERLQMEVPDIDELIESREKVMRDHLADRGATEVEIEATIKLFGQYESALDSDGSVRGTSWKLRRFAWDNMMNYGEGNVVDMTKLSGLVGIFAPNASGKSSIFDIMLQALFDKISKDVPRNIDLVNDNKDIGTMLVELESAGTPFTIERSIERIHYGQRKFAETKQWGKTTLDFSSVDESLNGTSRPETEREIRKIIGSFEDFALTSMVSQNPIFGLPGGGDLLNCRETDRRKILFRFLDLDVYEKILDDAKDDHKELIGKLKVDREKLEAEIADLDEKVNASADEVYSSREALDVIAVKIGQLGAVIAQMTDREELHNNLRRFRSSKVSQEKLVSDLEKKIDIMQSSLMRSREKQSLMGPRPDIPDVPFIELQKQMAIIQSSIYEKIAAEAGYAAKIASGEKRLTVLDQVPCGDQFPTCKFIKDAHDFRAERPSLEMAWTAASKVRQDLEVEQDVIEQLDVKHRAVTNWDTVNSALELEITRSESSLESLNASLDSARETLRAFDDRISELSAQISASEDDDVIRASSIQSIEELKRERERLQKAIDRALRSSGALEERRVQVKQNLAEYDELKSKARIHELLMEMCGKNGLPYRILSLVLPVINAEIAKILSGIVKFSVFFEDNAEEQSVSLSIRYGDYKSRPLSLGSGAEKFIASLAIRVALLSVSSLPKTDVLIIDEGFGKLDPEHLEALQRMFEYLREAFGTVFMVSHVDVMRDMVDHSIEINGQDGYAHVEVT